MYGLGTLINAAAIVAGGLIGLLGGKFFTERFQKILMDVCGISTVFIGIAGAMSGLLTVSQDGLGTQNSMMIIGSLVIGSIVGELINLEKRFEQFGGWLKVKTKSEKDHKFIDAFVTASLTVCIGAMAIVGAIEDALLGDLSILLTKAVLDFIIIIVMSASMGKGCIFSAIPVLIWQGLVTALAIFIEPWLSDAAIFNLSTVGSILIACVGLNLIGIRESKFKVANMLPAIIVAVVWGIVE